MAVYTWQCRLCGQHFEKYDTEEQNDEDKKIKCPKCGYDKVKRAFSPSGFGSTVCAGLGGRFT